MRVRRGGARWLVLLACLGVAVPLLATTGGSASGASPAGHGKTAEPSSSLEVDVMNEPVRGGEPELAIDPLHPQSLVLGHTVVGNTYTNPGNVLASVDGGLQMSADGGQSWTADKALGDAPSVPLSFSEGPNQFLINHGFPGATGLTLTGNGVGDPIEASGPDGSIYAGGVVAHAVATATPPFLSVPQGAIVVARSADGGKIFGPNSSVLSDLELQGMINRGMSPSLGGIGVNPFDRPWMVVDQSTGDVYVSTTAHPERYVAVSHDHATTWGRIEALDCNERTPPDANHDVTCGAYPESGGGNIAAANGVLAAAYIAGAAPGRTCPCAVFETSTDVGAHWSRHVAFDNLPAGSNVFVAADSFHRGRYAVLLLPGHLVPGGLAGLLASRNVPQEVQVVTTRDSGLRWSGPTALGNEPVTHITNRPWIAYTSVQQGRHGPTGVLAVLWRNAHPPYNPASGLVPGTQNVFAAISRNNGNTFSDPIQLNSAPSPPPDPNQFAEDDVSWVAVTTHDVYGAWGDWRATPGNPVDSPPSLPPSGELNSWIARVPLHSFRGDEED
jgi:hypothetical protein